MAKILVGIDPGVNTGLAVWSHSERKFCEVVTASIVGAMKIVRDYAVEHDVTIYTEDARKRKWIPREKSLSQFKGRAMGAGSVRRDSQIWEEFAAYYDIPIVLLPPRQGATKWSAEYFARVTGWKARTSNHARDAALLVFGK